MDGGTTFHTTELDDGTDYARMGSQTEMGNLDDFLTTAELSNRDFTAERMNVSIVTAVENEAIISEKREQAMVQVQKDNQHKLRIPRRPHWEKGMDKDALQQAERESFIEWRRTLAELQELEDVLMTPFERNIEFWRQLWRVIERSDLVVQIVDARNPLLFRCPDVDIYTKEVSGNKGSLLLLNKADLLTHAQRMQWSKYFKANNVDFAYFSALNEIELQEARATGKTVDDNGGPACVKPGSSEHVHGGGASAAPPPPASTTKVRFADEVVASEVAEAAVDHAYTSLSTRYPSTIGMFADVSFGLASGAAATGAAAATAASGSGADVEEPIVLDAVTVRELEAACFIHSSATLLALLRTKTLEVCAELGPDEVPTIGMVGYPNVGKSSTIVALCAQKKVPVSSTPGRTRHFQTILMGDMTLCDCPGLVFPNFANTKAEMLCNGILPIDQMTDHIPPMTHICRTISRDALEGVYGISIIKPSKEDPNQQRPPTAHELVDAYGLARGIHNGRGDADGPRVARPMLKDYVRGNKLKHCAIPPSDADTHTTTPIGVGTYTSREADPDASVFDGAQVAGTTAHNRRYISAVDEEFFNQGRVRALTKDKTGMARGKLGSKKHNKKGRKEKTRRMKPGTSHGTSAGFSFVK